MNKLKALVFLFPLFLIGCEPESPVTPSTPNASASASANDIATKKGSLVVTVRDGVNLQPVSNATAKIKLTDGTTVMKTTDSTGKATFDNLSVGNSYNVEVSADTYIANSASTSSSKLEIKSDVPASLTINLFKNLATLSGRVISTSGQPIDSAVVRVGDDSAITASNGTFKASVSNLTVQSISVAKIGYKTFEYGNIDFSKQVDNNSGDIKLTLSDNSTPSILFDTGKKPFGTIPGENINVLGSLNTLLQGSKYKTSFEDFSLRKTLDDLDVIVLPSPSVDYSDSDVTKLINFVRSGKKLVVLGEWGGYGGFRVDSINKVLKAANLQINPDVVKQEGQLSNDEEIISTVKSDHYIARSISKLSFYSSASVAVINGGVKNLDVNVTKLISLSDISSFRIQFYNKGQFGLIGVSTIGAGKVVAIGDSSVFMNIDSNANGKANIDENDNKKLALNIFSW